MKEKTELEKLEKSEKPEKQKKPESKKKKIDFSVEEIQEKLMLLFNFVSFSLKVEKEYKPADFLEESKDIVRLAKKYPTLENILTMLDPLFLILNLTKKAVEITKIWRKKEAAKKQVVKDGQNFTA